MPYLQLVLLLILAAALANDDSDQYMNEFSITLEKLKNESKVLLVRHSNSLLNFEEQKLVELNSPLEEFKKMRRREDLWDSPLSPLGMTQGGTTSDLASFLNITHVLISPLERALETTELIFRNHPNFDKIKFTVAPMLRERLHTTGDIPKNTTQRMERWSNIFPNFDTSLLEAYNDPDHFYIADLQDEVKHVLKYSKEHDAYGRTMGDLDDFLHDMCTNGRTAFEEVIDHAQSIHPEHIETVSNVINRIETVKEMIKSFFLEGNFDYDNKLVLVGHSAYFKLWTGKWKTDISNLEVIPEPDHFKFLQNGEMIPDPTIW